MSTTKVTLALFILVPGLLAVDIKTLDGKHYEGCQVSRVEPDSICVLFPGGGARIKFVNLGEDIQAQYGYDPVKAAEYEQAQTAKKAREDAFWRAVRTCQHARRQADQTNSVEQAKLATPDSTDSPETSPETSSERMPAAYGSFGGGRGTFGGNSGGGYQNQTYGGSAEYVGVELAPRTGQAYGQFSGGSGQGNRGGYGGGGWGGGGAATYVGVQLAPRRSGGGFGGGAGGFSGQGYR